MLAIEQYRERDLCALCGMPKEVCQAPYGTYVYDTEAPVRCQVKTAVRQAQKAHGGEHGDALMFPPRVRPWGSVAD